MPNLIVNEALKEWATTPTQIQAIDAVIASGGSMREAARSLGQHHSTVQKVIARVQRRAAISGYSPEHQMINPVPFGFLVKGRSDYYRVNPDGSTELRGFWQKTDKDDEARQEALKEAFEAMSQELPRLEPQPSSPAVNTSDDLCNLFTITDYHMGMLAWRKEGGADWDLKIAEDMIYRVFEAMIDRSPNAHTAVINQLGDFLHTDGLLPLTPTSGNILDADGRFPKIVGAAIRVLRRIIDRALQTHNHVHVIMAEGNHDIVGSIWLRAMFAALYENEPRVTVDDSALPYYHFQWGNTMLGFHHGHLHKNAGLPALFANQFRKAWGESSYVYIHTGHRHHREEKDHGGAIVVQHSTLAARDAHAARYGYMGNRQVRCITYSKVFGEVGTNTVTPEMLGYTSTP